jgi:hypothetical protein
MARTSSWQSSASSILTDQSGGHHEYQTQTDDRRSSARHRSALAAHSGNQECERALRVLETILHTCSDTLSQMRKVEVAVQHDYIELKLKEIEGSRK